MIRGWGTSFSILFAVVCGSVGILVGVGLTRMARGRTAKWPRKSRRCT
jgi:hypothetical protein